MALLIGTLIAALLIGLALFAVSKKDKTAAGGEGNFNYASLPYAGKEDAKVNVVVVEDFKCPACKGFEESVTPQLHSNYVDNGKIKLYSLVWPFISSQVVPVTPDDSTLAAQGARCVFEQGGNDAYNRFKPILFRAQGDEREAWATKDRLKELAGSVEGLDQEKFATCLDTDATLAAVQEDKKAAEAAGVTGTPTVFVNGKRVESGYAEISKAIDEALK